MARGQRRSLDDKIAAKQEIIDALSTRMEAEKKEMAELVAQKRKKELEAVSELIGDYGLAPDEVMLALQQFMDTRQVALS